MNWIIQTFLRGLITLLPIALSIYFILWFFSKMEELMKSALSFIPGFPYYTGLGIFFGILIIFLLGLIMNHMMTQKIFKKIENLMESLPIIKSVYTASKDFMNFFKPKESGLKQKVVIVGRPGEPNDRIGILTNESVHVPGLEDRIAVYMPMSYQIGGETAFVPKSWVREIDMDVEEAMRAALTAWIPKN